MPRKFYGFVISGGNVYGHTGPAHHGRPNGNRVRLGSVRKVKGGWKRSGSDVLYKRQADAAKAVYRAA